MRDDFAEEAKRALAARVGNQCSHPDCGALTSGPQDNPAKALNVSVAAHITAAAAGGPRYNSSLTAEQRVSPDNGIWLCQTCAKLVDNDTLQFPEDVLRAWKTLAEHRARTSIGKTQRAHQTESEAQRKQRKILEWHGKHVTLSQMNTGRAVFLMGPKRGSGCVRVLDCTEDFVRVGETGVSLWARSISLSNIEICFDDANQRLELQERY